MKKLLVALMMVLPMCASAQKFGHFDSAAVIQSMPEYTTAQNEVQAKAKTYEDELKRMQDELQKKAEDFDKESATLPEAIKTRRQNELQEMYQKIQTYAQDAQQNMQKTEQEKMQAISQKLTKAIEEVGAAGGYAFVLVDGSMPYINKSVCTDVTAQVKSKLGLK